MRQLGAPRPWACGPVGLWTRPSFSLNITPNNKWYNLRPLVGFCVPLCRLVDPLHAQKRGEAHIHQEGTGLRHRRPWALPQGHGRYVLRSRGAAVDGWASLDDELCGTGKVSLLLGGRRVRVEVVLIDDRCHAQASASPESRRRKHRQTHSLAVFFCFAFPKSQDARPFFTRKL